MATVFLDGQFHDIGSARISAFDAGFQHGVGLFETMLAVASPDRGVRVLHLREHVNRLAASARALLLTETLRIAALEEAVERTCERAFASLPEVTRLRVRLTMTGGDLNLIARARGGEAAAQDAAQRPTLMIVAQPATRYPAPMFEQGVVATVADWRLNPFDPDAGHKTLNYWARLRELQSAAGRGAAESLIFSLTNHLAGGCVSNAFVIKNDVILTPFARGEESEVFGEDADAMAGALAPGLAATADRESLRSPVLPGIVRRWAIDWAESRGMEVQRRMLSVNDVLDADEVLLTNSSWGVLPVVQVEQKRIGSGVGPVASALVNEWKQLAEVE